MLTDQLQPFALKNYQIKTLVIESESLKSNPLNDECVKYNPILVPHSKKEDQPVVLMLSGYAGDGVKNFAFKGFENSLVQDIDLWTSEGLIPEAVYVFVNAWTSVGGSQFINSKGLGSYEDYIISELVPEIKKQLPVSTDPSYWALQGGSSGGYGALSLASKYGDVFKKVIAIAPDSFFEVSLLPELYKAWPVIQELGGCKEVLRQLKSGELKLSGSAFFQVMNALAMSFCYAPLDEQGEPIFPFNEKGEKQDEIWSQWKKHDPLVFLPERKSSLKSVENIYLSVGTKDEYGLQYGARQIESFLKNLDLNSHYKEFKGTHRDLSKDRKEALQWLKNIW